LEKDPQKKRTIINGLKVALLFTIYFVSQIDGIETYLIIFF